MKGRMVGYEQNKMEVKVIEEWGSWRIREKGATSGVRRHYSLSGVVGIDDDGGLRRFADEWTDGVLPGRFELLSAT